MKKRLVLLILSKDKEEIKNSLDLKKALCHEVWIVESSEFTGFKDDLYSRVVTEVVREKIPMEFFPIYLSRAFSCPENSWPPWGWALCACEWL